MEMLIGLAGAVLGIGVFVLGFALGCKFTGSQQKGIQSMVAGMTENEIEEAKLERQRLLDMQNDFNAMMNYNMDIAYQMDQGRNKEGTDK